MQQDGDGRELERAAQRAPAPHPCEPEDGRLLRTLRENEERFRLIEENVRDYAIFTVDLDGCIDSWNVGAERILGYSADEILGQSGEIIFTPEERAEGVPKRELQTAADTGRSEDERWHVRKDGSRFWASGIMTALRDEAGRLRGFVKILRDQTARRQAEDALRTLNERLQHAMRETHHRVKNNLQVIAAMVDMRLMEGTQTVPSDDLRRMGAHIRSLAAVHDLLTQQADVLEDVRLVSVKAILDKLLPLIQQTAHGRPIRFEAQDAFISTRQGTSLALLTNELVSNALKHGRGAIQVTFEVRGDTARLEVCDDGPGFPSGFDPAKSANTGLELVSYLSRWDLGGFATYENRAPEEGGGARVAVTFPLPAAGG